MSIERFIDKKKIEEQGNNFAYWQNQPHEIRLATLEEIRREFHSWKYGTEPRFQGVHTTIKR